MKIWIDADACPGVIREIVLKAARRLEVAVVFVANKPIHLPDSPLFSSILVAQGADVADGVIAAQAVPGDLVITQDIPLAAELVDAGVVALSPYGTLFTSSNIGERLSVRNFLHEARMGGMVTGGPKPFGDKEKRTFSNLFDQTLTRLHRLSP